MNISFGKKIPTAQCNILNKSSKKFEPAIIYEFDCKDKSDIDEILYSLDDNWEYKDTIAMNMGIKNFSIKVGMNNDARFYTLENQNGEILGISYVDDLQQKVELRYLESKAQSPYKYVGQNLLATIGKNLLNGDQNSFFVRSAVSSAFDFYEKACGFKDIGCSDLKMNRDDIHKFVNKTEEKTKTQIIDLRG